MIGILRLTFNSFTFQLLFLWKFKKFFFNNFFALWFSEFCYSTAPDSHSLNDFFPMSLDLPPIYQLTTSWKLFVWFYIFYFLFFFCEHERKKCLFVWSLFITKSNFPNTVFLFCKFCICFKEQTLFSQLFSHRERWPIFFSYNFFEKNVFFRKKKFATGKIVLLQNKFIFLNLLICFRIQTPQLLSHFRQVMIFWKQCVFFLKIMKSCAKVVLTTP